MDLSFFMRAERILSREPTPAIDHGVLVAVLAAHQAVTATAAAAALCRSGGAARANPSIESLAELLAGGPGWEEARRAQRGSFARGGGRAARKEP